MAVWKDPTYRASHFIESVLAAEGFDVSDPMAMIRVRQAITDAQVWLWGQHDWWWAVSPTSPARFEVFPQTTVVKASASGQPDLNVADTGEFQVGDTILIAEGVSGAEEIGQINSITVAVKFTLEEDLEITHSVADAAKVRPLRPLVADPSVRTRVDASSAAGGTTLNVEATTGFAVNDYILIDPGSVLQTEERNKISAVTDGVSFTLFGPLIQTFTASNVYKAVEEDPKFDLTLVNGGVMADFGRATKVLIDGEGPLRPMNRSRWLSSREEGRTGGVSVGDWYIIEGEPPQMKFETTPTSNKTVVVHYLRAPTLVHGDDDIQMPWPFHNLLRWCSRLMLQKNGPAGALLGGDQDILSEVQRLKSFSLDDGQPASMRPLTGVLPGNVDAAVPGAAVLASRFDDFS